MLGDCGIYHAISPNTSFSSTKSLAALDVSQHRVIFLRNQSVFVSRHVPHPGYQVRYTRLNPRGRRVVGVQGQLTEPSDFSSLPRGRRVICSRDCFYGPGRYRGYIAGLTPNLANIPRGTRQGFGSIYFSDWSHHDHCRHQLRHCSFLSARPLFRSSKSKKLFSASVHPSKKERQVAWM